MIEFHDISGRTWRFTDGAVEFNGAGGGPIWPGKLEFDTNHGELFSSEPFAFVDFGDGNCMAFYDDHAVQFHYIGPPVEFEIRPVFMRKREPASVGFVR